MATESSSQIYALHPRAPGRGTAVVARKDREVDKSVLAARLRAAKRSFCVRRIDTRGATLLGRQHAPEVGSLLLAKVVELGHQTRIELADGRRARLFVGDEVLVCYGHRYAPDQYGIRVPADLRRCALATSGGVAGEMECRHEAIGRPTLLQPIGLLGDAAGAAMNLAQFSIPPAEPFHPSAPVFAVLGSSMNAGKTTTAANAIRGLANAGLRVAAAKVSGTGSGADYWHMLDAGAVVVRDFSDCGLPSTFREDVDSLRRVFFSLLSELEKFSPDAIVIEVSDGFYQRETAAILAAPWFRAHVHRVLLAAQDAMSLVAGVAIARRHGLRVAALSGLVSRSPLAIDEAVEQCGLPVLTSDALQNPEAITPLLFAEPA